LNCKSVISELSNYLDGELELAAKRQLEQHLVDCQECNLVVNQTKLTVDIFCDSEPVALPPDVQTRLHEALRRKFSEKRT
jgi:anti-sigma factor RsiW